MSLITITRQEGNPGQKIHDMDNKLSMSWISSGVDFKVVDTTTDIVTVTEGDDIKTYECPSLVCEYDGGINNLIIKGFALRHKVANGEPFLNGGQFGDLIRSVCRKTHATTQDTLDELKSVLSKVTWHIKSAKPLLNGDKIVMRYNIIAIEDVSNPTPP